MSDNQGDEQMETMEELFLASFDETSSSLTSLSAQDVEALLSKQSPSSLIASIIPHVFHTDTVHQSAAERLLTSVLSHKPSLLLVTSTSILSFSKTLTPSTEFNVSSFTLQLILKQLTHQTVSIADTFSQVIQILASIRPPLISKILEVIQPLLKQDATVITRCYALIFQIITNGYIDTCMEDISTATLFTDVMQPFMDGIANENDPLLQMSLLDIVETTTTGGSGSGSGRQDFIQNWNNPKLDKILLHMVGFGVPKGQSELHPFCAGAALRILAVRAGRGRVQPLQQSFMTQEEFVQVLVHYGRSMNGEIEKIGFIDGITTFCECECECECEYESTSSETKLEMVLKNQELLEEWLTLRRGQSKVKAIVMSSVAKVIMQGLKLEFEQEVQRDARVRNASHATKLELFKKIGTVNDVGGGQDSAEIVMKYVMGQIVELRLAAYELLTAVANINVGASMLMRFGGFFEFLCNRNLEIVREGKLLKYELVKAVVKSDVMGLLADGTAKMLKQVAADGPFFVKAVREVVMMDE